MTRRRVERHQIVSQRSRRKTEPVLKPADLHDATPDALRGLTYLTVRQARNYLQLGTEWAIYKLLEREPRIRRRRFGRQLRIWRADLDPPSIRASQRAEQVLHGEGQ